MPIKFTQILLRIQGICGTKIYFSDFNILLQAYTYTLPRPADGTIVFFSILERLIWEVCNFFMNLESVRIQALGSEIVAKSRFRPPAFVYNNKRPVILSFLSFRECEIINRLLKHLVSKNRLHISEPTFTLRQTKEFSERKRGNLGKVFKSKRHFYSLLFCSVQDIIVGTMQKGF